MTEVNITMTIACDDRVVYDIPLRLTGYVDYRPTAGYYIDSHGRERENMEIVINNMSEAYEFPANMPVKQRTQAARLLYGLFKDTYETLLKEQFEKETLCEEA